MARAVDARSPMIKPAVKPTIRFMLKYEVKSSRSAID
jgi:hypothetical protein